MRVSEKPPVRPWESSADKSVCPTGENPENVAPKRKPRCTKAEKLQRNHWRWEWEQQLDMPAFVRQMKEEGNWTPDQKAYFEREHGYHDVICDCCDKTKL